MRPVKTRAGFALVIFAALALSACDSNAGPTEVKLGRDVCEMCGMIISDPRFIAEVRLADGQAHKFDDAGDAVNWLSQACVDPIQAKEFWAIDERDGKTWLDARSAVWLPAKTPMDYGFAAAPAGTPGAISFAEMRAKVLRPQYACKNDAKAKP